MMLAAFTNMETVHIAAYSHLLDTIGMPESEYRRLPRIQGDEGQARLHAAPSASTPTRDIASTLAMFGAFTEGLQLFASFAMLMNFPRFNKMKGMGQIVTWSVRDESLHCEGIIKLFHAFVQGEPERVTKAVARRHRRLLPAPWSAWRTSSSTWPSSMGAVQGMTPERDQELHPLHRRLAPDAARPASRSTTSTKQPAALAATTC